ncbi:MAG: hypothetical protein HQK77_16085 [Desulfobacterales bacterium]|nr:hypothetical protein [Desulfobacterales bacterium]
MIVKLLENKVNYSDYSDLSPNQLYFVIGIEADDYRLLNDYGKPYLYPATIFKVIEPTEPSDWITEYGDNGERYSYPKLINEVGFFEDYFDGIEKAIFRFWHVVNQHLSKVAA